MEVIEKRGTLQVTKPSDEATNEMLKAGQEEMLIQFRRWQTDGIFDVKPIWDAMIAARRAT